MRKTLLALAAFLLALAAAGATKPKKNPLAFVPADSVFFWSQDLGNLRLLALAADPDLHPQRFLADAAARKNFKKDVEKWEQRAGSELNLVGGIGDEGTEPQALPAAALLYSSATLWLQTADGRYAETMEKTLFNALPAALSSELPLEKQVAAQALMNGAGMAFATDREGVFVNFYANCLARICTKELKLTLDVQTGMPYEEQVKIRVGGLKEHQTFKLRLHLPSWALGQAFPDARYAAAESPRPTPVAYINGREEELAVVDGYWEITRNWRNGDEIFFSLPLTPLLVRQSTDGNAQRGKVALQRGPLVYAPATATQGCLFSATAPLSLDYSEKYTSSVALSGTLFKADGTPADAAAPPVPFFAVPYAEKARPIWLDEAR